MSNKILLQFIKGFVLIILVLAVYIPAMNYGYNWDDKENIINNTAIKTTEGLKNIWIKPGTTYQYYPLVFTSFWIEYNIFGLNPHISHFINALLHGLNSLLLWMIMRRLNLPGAWLAASIFALHPVHVESVAWITERKNVLSGFFYLGALIAYLRFSMNINDNRFFQNSPRTNSKKRTVTENRFFYLLSFFLFCCALTSKSVTCTLPAAILVILWWKQSKITWADVMPLSPFFLAAIIFSLNTIFMEKQLGAQGAYWSFSFIEKFLIAGKALWFYIKKLILPYDICFIYPKWDIDSGNWSQYLYPFTIIFLIILLWRMRKHIGKGPLSSVLLFCGTLFPALGFFNVYFHRYSYVQDHFQYLASIALIALFVNVLINIIKKIQYIHISLFYGLYFMVIVTLGMTNYQEQLKFKNEESLWVDTISKNPNAAIAYGNLGKIKYHQGQKNEAVKYLTTAFRLDPNLFEAHNNLGNVFLSQKKYKEAVKHFTEAERIRPNHLSPIYNLGCAYAEMEDFDKAVHYFNRALNMNPYFTGIYVQLGKISIIKKEYNKAEHYFLKALEIKPDERTAQNFIRYLSKEKRKQ